MLENLPTQLETSVPVDYEEYMRNHSSTQDVVRAVRAIDNERLHGSSFNSPKRSDLPGYIGSGYEKVVFDLGDGDVVKILNKGFEPGSFVGSIDIQVDSLQAGLGINGLEQLVTADKKQGVIVTKKAPGTSVVDIPMPKLSHSITREHLNKLRDTLQAMIEKGIECENPENVMFDTNEGFTIIDYRAKFTERSQAPVGNQLYNEYAQKHDPQNFLNWALSYKKDLNASRFDIHGEPETVLKDSLGRRALYLLFLQRKLR